MWAGRPAFPEALSFPGFWRLPTFGAAFPIFKDNNVGLVVILSRRSDMTSVTVPLSTLFFGLPLALIRIVVIPLNYPRQSPYFKVIWLATSIVSAVCISPCSVIQSLVPGVRMWTSLGDRYSAYRQCMWPTVSRAIWCSDSKIWCNSIILRSECVSREEQEAA